MASEAVQVFSMEKDLKLSIHLQSDAKSKFQAYTFPKMFGYSENPTLYNMYVYIHQRVSWIMP